MELKPTLDQAFNSASIGIISTDQFGNIAAINQQASEIKKVRDFPVKLIAYFYYASLSNILTSSD